MAKGGWSLASAGLRLPRAALERLRKAGIFVQPAVSVEHQHLAQRYVLRGIESGGAVKEFGHYVTFAAPDGKPIPCLCPVESLAVNGPHAVVVAPALLRAEMLRAGRTYELLITRHMPTGDENGRWRKVHSEVIFHGEHGHLELDLTAQKAKGSAVLPTFWSRSGEPLRVPADFIPMSLQLVAAVNCVPCSHSHYLERYSGPDVVVQRLASGRIAPGVK